MCIGADGEVFGSQDLMRSTGRGYSPESPGDAWKRTRRAVLPPIHGERGGLGQVQGYAAARAAENNDPQSGECSCG
jgi:hypothetical protein